MKNDLLFEFSVNKADHSVHVKREFTANLDQVWKAWTNPELLDKWWAPKPWSSKTKYMDFKVGGRRFYAMCSPEGEEHWAIQDFTAISPKANFKFLDSFSDRDENPNTELPSSEWSLNFNEKEGYTAVDITIRHKTLNDLEKIIEMGFKEGFTMTLNELEKQLKSQQQ